MIASAFLAVSSAITMAGSALIAPMLQRLMGYGVVDAGMTMIPRGASFTVAMVVSGRLVTRVDPPVLIAIGISIAAWSQFMMSGFNLEMGPDLVITSAIAQGTGMGLMMMPINLLAFATLPSELRTEGASIYSLFRNVGSAIGISVTSALVTQNGQVEHSILSGFITPLNRAFQGAAANLMPTTAHGAQVLNQMVTRQAEIIAYNNDWKLMMLTALPMLLLLPLMRSGNRQAGGDGHAAVMD